MSHRRLPSLRVSWRVFRRRLTIYGWSWGAGRLRGWIPWGWSPSVSMASHAACGIHPPAGLRRQFSADTLRGRRTRPSREGSVRANFRSSQSCVWVQRCHHCPWAGLWRCRGGCLWWGHGDGWRWCAPGSPRSPVPWKCMGSGGMGERGPEGMRAQCLLRGSVEIRGGGISGASAGCGLTSGIGRGAGTLLVGPGAALVRSGVLCLTGIRALRNGRTRCVTPRPRRAPQ